ncbi:hypothetical protein BE04_50190 [Sorangium cellulosum]|uniref:Uncharacterized protein n=2 Tax=Sorangium cellulosum TaxID=56 RepID=A0A150PP11_SORCE|nr:hypothetical protein BE04_50190 [Sorangium cellulosum]
MTHTADPARAFSAIFGGVSFDGAAPTSSPTSTPDAVAAAKRSADERILQINTSELKTLQRFLGKAEREKLELHVEALFELQQRIAGAGMGGGASGPVGGACERADVSGYNGSTNNATTIARWAQIQADIIVNAFTCDRTRVADYHVSFSGGHQRTSARAAARCSTTRSCSGAWRAARTTTTARGTCSTWSSAGRTWA